MGTIYYIDFTFVGNATKPDISELKGIKWYWDKTNTSKDSLCGNWNVKATLTNATIITYNTNNFKLSTNNISWENDPEINTGYGYEFSQYDNYRFVKFN